MTKLEIQNSDHRHHQNVASSHDINIADHHTRQRREKAILESNLDYQVKPWKKMT